MKSRSSYVFVKTVAAFAALVGLLVSASPSKADDVESNASNQRYVGALRGGIHYNENSTVRSDYGTLAGFGGISYTIEGQPYVNRLSLAVDYTYASGNGNTEQIIPVMLEYQAYQGLQSHMRPYVTFGAGLVNVKLKDANRSVDGSGSTFGAMVGYGVDLQSQMFVEARYDLIPDLMSENLSGPDLMVGIRF